MPGRRVKIGIDVGGTFTHAVALDAESLSIVGRAMVPTTHRAAEGVARGVVDVLHLLLKRASIRPREVILIAHSTTQATNALLEGDVARVGIIGMGKGMEGRRARHQTNVRDIVLAPGKTLKTYHRFIDTTNGMLEEEISKSVDELRAEGAEVFVASEAFGVDNPENEMKVASQIRGMGYQATASSEISQLYGLRIRTRTAIINASMLPRMLETADMTERSVRKSGIRAPLMIMRSDGGIMDIAEMRRRPILTMLSGPAAGVTAALMYIRISDGIFLEVGGTSTDISIIRNGRPMVRAAEVGGHKLYVHTLDIRTVGIAGGSMPRIRGKRIVDVGPRSAHIAGLRYVAFARGRDVKNPALHLFQPRPGDPDDYLAISVRGEPAPAFAFSTTEAANVLKLATKYARANREALDPIAQWLSRELGTQADGLAMDILTKASEKVEDVIRNFIAEYELDASLLSLVGGGGGAETIVPFAAHRLKMDYTVAHNAEVISAIGVALGMIRDTIERSSVNPTEGDILRVRNEAAQSVVRMGAAPETVEVRVEVDTRQKRLVATATGSPEMRARRPRLAKLHATELRAIASRSCKLPETAMELVGGTEFLKVYRGTKVHIRFLGLIKDMMTPVRVVDTEGIVRLKLGDALIHSGSVSELSVALGPLIEENTVYGDAGGLLPDVFVVSGSRILDLSGLLTKDQVLSLLRAETERFSPDEPAVALVTRK